MSSVVICTLTTNDVFRGTGASWTAGRRHKWHLSRIAWQFPKLLIPLTT